jgi:HEAT repeat protein
MKQILIAALLLGSTAFAQEAKLLDVLKSDAPYKEKSDACRELQHLATKAAVPTLAGLLTDEKLSHMARYALEPLPDPSVDEALRAALDKVKGRLLAGVITSLGVRRDAKAVEPVAKFLADSDPDVARAAAHALGDIGTSAAANILMAAKTSQLPVCEGLLRCAEKLPKKEAIAIYDKLVALPNAPHQVHTAALRGAVLSRGKDGLPLLLTSLRSDDYAAVLTAVRVSMELPGADVTRALAGDLAKANADKQLLLIQTLGARGDAAATSALVAAAKSGPAGHRVAAIKSLGQLGDSAAVPTLKELATDTVADVAAAAQTALVSFPGKKADDAVLSLLSHSDAKMRATAISLAAQRRLAAALPTLSKLAEDADASIASASLKALGDIGGPAEVPVLINLLLKAKSTGPAESALAAVCTRHPGTMDPLCAALPKAEGEAKLSLLRLLRIGGGAKALAAVRAATNDANTETKETALRTLCDWPTPDALTDLTQLAKTSADQKWKILAIRGMLRLIPQQNSPDAQKLAALKDAMALVERTEEKRLALAALGDIPTAESLALVATHLSDKALNEEACNAAVSIAQKIIEKNPAAVADVLKKVSPKNKRLNQQAKTLLEQAKAAAGK